MAERNTYAEFSPTRWTLIDALRGEDEALRRQAQIQLAEQYLSPIYSFIRGQGFQREQAAELTQSFFAEVVYGRNLFERANSQKAKLRTYLKAAIGNHIIDQRRKDKRRESIIIPASVLEQEEQNFLDLQGLPAEDLFERRWAAAVLSEALRRCRERFVDSGQTDRFEIFERWFCCFLGTDAYARPDATQLAAETGLSSADQVYAIVRKVRQRFREAIEEVVREQVSDESELQAELAQIISAIGVRP